MALFLHSNITSSCLCTQLSIVPNLSGISPVINCLRDVILVLWTSPTYICKKKFSSLPSTTQASWQRPLLLETQQIWPHCIFLWIVYRLTYANLQTLWRSLYVNLCRPYSTHIRFGPNLLTFMQCRFSLVRHLYFDVSGNISHTCNMQIWLIWLLYPFLALSASWCVLLIPLYFQFPTMFVQHSYCPLHLW
jgi:hypothetical protein